MPPLWWMQVVVGPPHSPSWPPVSDVLLTVGIRAADLDGCPHGQHQRACAEHHRRADVCPAALPPAAPKHQGHPSSSGPVSPPPRCPPGPHSQPAAAGPRPPALLSAGPQPLGRPGRFWKGWGCPTCAASPSRTGGASASHPPPRTAGCRRRPTQVRGGEGRGRGRPAARPRGPPRRLHCPPPPPPHVRSRVCVCVCARRGGGGGGRARGRTQWKFPLPAAATATAAAAAGRRKAGAGPEPPQGGEAAPAPRLSPRGPGPLPGGG